METHCATENKELMVETCTLRSLILIRCCNHWLQKLLCNIVL